jgi:hypothetical protein
MKTVPRPYSHRNLVHWILLLLLSLCAGAATACVLTGCNMVARAAIGAGQGLSEDLDSACRHGRQQLDHADKDGRDERTRLEGRAGQ